MPCPPLDTLPDFLASGRTFLELYIKASLAPANTLTGWSLDDRDPAVIAQLLPFFGWFYHYYFCVQSDGWEHIPHDRPVLLIGSHNGGLAAPDTVMMSYEWFQRFGCDRPVYALMDPRIWQVLPGLARLATQVGTLHPHPHLAIAALRRGASVLIYPGGMQDVFRPCHLRHWIHFHGQHGFIKLALQEDVPIVPLISTGAHSTLIVLADLYPYLQTLHRLGLPWPLGIDPGVFPIYLGLPWGISLGPLPNIPLPVPLHTRVCAPIVFERSGADAAHDRTYVDACYQQVCTQMQQDLDRLVAETEHQLACGG